jgi:hypothetical protein
LVCLSQMNVVGLALGMQREVKQAMHSLGTVIDVVRGRPVIDRPGLIGAHHEGQRLGAVGTGIFVRTINHGV